MLSFHHQPSRSQSCLILVGLFAAFGFGMAAAEDFTFGNRTLHVPDGFEVTQVTSASLVERPIAVSRDERGRLYVTDSGGMTERAEQQLAAKPHSIRRLEDTDGDGQYDTSTLFADRMMFPEGCQWFDGSLYVAAPPEIWKLTDLDDDGVADKREVWFDGKTLTGCGNDLHGPYLGLDGRLYWCKGAFAEQSYTLPDGHRFTTRSSHIFRAKPDGSEIEPVLTGGMDNPVNVAFLPNGERFLSCTFFQFPEAGRRDGLIHAIYGGVYGKRHASIYDHPMTGDVMPVLNHQSAAAPCGLIAGSDSLFGGAAADNLFACYFNLHKVVRHQLLANGPTYTTLDQDFVTCDHPDFHPTDVYEDADGSLLVVDTGGWYKVCCPTSQLAKPDVLGAVYRIRPKGSPAVRDPQGHEIAWDKGNANELARLLEDPRLFVQRRATAQLRKTGTSGVAALEKLVRSHARSDVRRRAVWTLAGMDLPAARAAVRIALKDADVVTRQAAIHTAGLWRDAAALPELLQALASDHAGHSRAAAEAIGRIRGKSAVPNILAASAKLTDSLPDSSGAPDDAAARIREHALIYSLIEIGDPNATAAGLASSSSKTQRAAVVALDQMRDGGLRPELVVPLMEHPDAALRATAVWIVGHHADWGPEVESLLGTRLLAAAKLSETEREQLVDLLAGLSRAPEIQSLLQQTLGAADGTKAEVNATAKVLALQAMSKAGLAATPPPWMDTLAEFLPQADTATLPLAVAASRNWPLPKEGHSGLRTALLKTAGNETLDPSLRLDAAVAAGPGISPDEAMFRLLTESLNQDQPMERRSAAAGILSTAALSPAQREALLKTVPIVGALELPKLLPAFEREPTEPVGLQLVAALMESQGLRGLRTDLVKPLLEKFPISVQDAGKPLLTSLNVNAGQQAEHLEQLLTDLPEGDVRRGHEVFMGKKAACITCHKLGYGGGRLGPDLSNIGKVRNRRDLLEAIVYPGVSIVRGYEPVTIELQDGRVLNGIIISENRDEVVLGIDAQKTNHIVRTEIEQILPSQVSPMPNGMVTVLTPQEMGDLMAFLTNLK